MTPWISLMASSCASLVFIGIAWGTLRSEVKQNALQLKDSSESIKDQMDEIKRTKASNERMNAFEDRIDRFEESLNEKIESFHRRLLRKVLGVKWPKRMTNVEVYRTS